MCQDDRIMLKEWKRLNFLDWDPRLLKLVCVTLCSIRFVSSYTEPGEALGVIVSSTGSCWKVTS